MCRKNRKKEIEKVEKPASGHVGSLTFQELETLNNDLYRICGEMHENKDFINDPVLKSVMWKEITKAYMAQSNEIKESKVIPEAIRRWTLKEKYKVSMPDYELVRRFPRRFGPNEVAEQCIKQAQIEAAMEYAAREAEIERQKEFIDGDEPDAVTEFFYLLADEFIPARKRKRFINSRYKRITRLMTEYAQNETADKLYEMLLNELVKEKKHEKFEEQNGEYLKILIDYFIEAYTSETEEREETGVDEQTSDDTEKSPETSAETAETSAPEEEPAAENTDAEGTEDELDELDELEESEDEPEDVDEALTEPEALPEELSEEPVQEQIELALTSEPIEPVQELVPQTANEPAESGNADGETENEE